MVRILASGTQECRRQCANQAPNSRVGDVGILLFPRYATPNEACECLSWTMGRDKPRPPKTGFSRCCWVFADCITVTALSRLSECFRETVSFTVEEKWKECGVM